MKQSQNSLKNNNTVKGYLIQYEEDLPKEAFEMIPSEGEEVVTDDVYIVC